MTHASHFYSNSTNLYFVFILKPENRNEFSAFYKGIIDAVIKHGGSLSHHHGIGKLFGPWMESHLGKAQMGILNVLRSYFDPNHIMNPGGTLGLCIPDEEKRSIKIGG
jgi:alkyldihydroxyacetonephosphate synthase